GVNSLRHSSSYFATTGDAPASDGSFVFMLVMVEVNSLCRPHPVSTPSNTAKITRLIAGG
ncbi:MAG TPA: hypothetical protein VK530_06615, partial [Candidatus Acidoferrum sp.]|nr:hypothetical protein [Candidatus Acidoferrum sp.]